jgi:hypothetical protein
LEPRETEQPLTERKVVRRGLLAGLAAIGAAAAMKVTGASKTVEATDGDLLRIGNVAFSGSAQTMQSITTLNASPAPFNNYGLLVANGAPPPGGLRVGVAGSSDAAGGAGVLGFNPAPGGFGVWGESSNGIGLRGTSNANNGFGVVGIVLSNTLGATGAAISGICNASALDGTGDGAGDGVRGKSGAGRGVVGESIAGNAVVGATQAGIGVLGTSVASFGVNGVNGNNGIGIKGVSNSGGNVIADGNGNGIGVQGKSTGGPGVKGESVNAPGVEGISTNGLGVRAVSTNFVGIVGISTANHGLYGSTSSAAAAGFVGENLAPGGLAGYFAGNVQITGALMVGGAKNAVIKMQDGTTAAVYCQESPEPYFEDFGKAQLVGGVANVALEREFASLIAGGEYMVFPVPEGDTRGLYVSRKGPGGFEVREQQGGTSSVAFTYRVVTRRKDIEGRRFARVVDNVGPSLAASRAALGVTGQPPAGPTAPSPVVPPTIVPVPNAPSPTLPSNNAPPVNPTQPGPIQQPGRPSITGP